MRRLGTCLRSIVLGASLSLEASSTAKPGGPWNALEARRATISRIEVDIGEVFDLSKPEENIWIGRTANRLHASTHETVIRRVLLFEEGGPVRERVIHETERLLRALPFVKDARIDPIELPDGTVTAVVRVRDAWTLQMSASYSKVGGQTATAFGISEVNCFGFGKSVAFDTATDHERHTWGLSYGDPQLFGSRWTLFAHTQYLTDGYLRSLQVERPFFALDTPWSTGVEMSKKRASLHLYDRATEVFNVPFGQDSIRLSGAMLLHESGDRVWRGGLLMKREDTSYGPVTQVGSPGFLAPPPLSDRRLRGPGLTFSTQKDAYDVFIDLQGMDSPEDYNLAWTGEVELGMYSRAFGSTLTAPFFRVKTGSGWSSSDDNLTLLAAAWEGRMPATGLEDSRMGLSLTQYLKLTPNQILAGMVAVNRAQHPDPENWYYLGGDQGMRGFPNFLHPGDASWLASFDYRLLTDQRWWGIVRLGYIAFVDLGSIHRMDGQGWSRTYADVGVGLRLGNLKSSAGRVILLSLAVPVNREGYQPRWQFTVGNAMRF